MGGANLGIFQHLKITLIRVTVKVYTEVYDMNNYTVQYYNIRIVALALSTDDTPPRRCE